MMMKQTDVEKYLKVGCMVDVSGIVQPRKIVHLDAEYIWTEGKETNSRYYWSSIIDIISWPIPEEFNEKHVGHWIKVADPKKNINDQWKSAVGKWYQIKRISRIGHPIISFNLDGNVSLQHIGDYRPIAPVGLSEDQYYEIKLSDVEVGDQVMSLDCWCTVTERDGDTFKLFGRSSRYKASPNDLKARRKITPISDEEFDNLKPGDRLKLASAEYIDGKCEQGDYRGITHLSRRVDRSMSIHYGKDTAVFSLRDGDFLNISGYTIHRDFVVGVVKGKVELPRLNISITQCDEGDFVRLDSSLDTWIKVVNPFLSKVKFPSGKLQSADSNVKYRIKHFSELPYGWYFKSEKVWYRYPSAPGVHWKDVDAISEEQPNGEIALGEPQPCVLQIKKEEKIMLRTVEDIKQLDGKNIEEAAKKVKQNRDNAEVKEAEERLTQLLDKKDELETEKKAIEKELKEIDALVAALGYPPKE